ncbi:MAG: ATP-dependent DNA ligase [Bacteroidetes bacterium]|nr:ATP-dependent DNA ligase [Bacteroidota bacterium]
MKQFADLFIQLDQTTKTNTKVAELARYFAEAEDKDKLWTMALLSHRRPKRTVTTTLLREWAAEQAGIPLWLFEESYHVVGDLAESIALVLPDSTRKNNRSLSDWIDFIRHLKDQEEADKREAILEAWDRLDKTERFVFNKLITGGFRMGVSQKLMTRALSKYTGIEENILAHRMMGNWHPDETTFDDLILTEDPLDDISRPYPFFLAYALDDGPEDLGEVAEWQAEHKWDGIRGQLIVREGELFVWSRGEELVTTKYPEFEILTSTLPNGTVIDGEILPFKDGEPLPFQKLQKRIGRKKVGKKLLADVPVILMAYDLLEWEGRDIRDWPLLQRREKLEKLVAENPAGGVLQISEIVSSKNWEFLAAEREQAREKGSEGLMLKKRNSPYQSGRKKGSWWKWKVDPYTVDAVMIYAQSGHGRRANLFTDYTFAVWDGDKLVPFTKAYSGLTDAEFQEITRWVRRNTRERFGPVRSVNPELVFELAFEGINESSRHKSGIALRFPRMVRWRRDKPVSEINTLEDLKALVR